jgi:hypothetical protein
LPIFFFHIFSSILLMNGSIFTQFSIWLNSRDFPAIPIDVDSLDGLDANITPADPVAARKEVVVQPRGA